MESRHVFLMNTFSLICFIEPTCCRWTTRWISVLLDEDAQFHFTFSPGKSCRNTLGEEIQNIHNSKNVKRNFPVKTVGMNIGPQLTLGSLPGLPGSPGLPCTNTSNTWFNTWSYYTTDYRWRNEDKWNYTACCWLIFYSIQIKYSF